MKTFFFTIPFSQVDEANALAGFEVFDKTLSRGVDRSTAVVYGHGSLGSDKATESFAARLRAIGGQAIETEKLGKLPDEAMAELGAIKRPDLERLNLAQLREIATKQGKPTAGTKAALLDALELDQLEEETKGKK